jgi:hypothetical protein
VRGTSTNHPFPTFIVFLLTLLTGAGLGLAYAALESPSRSLDAQGAVNASTTSGSPTLDEKNSLSLDGLAKPIVAETTPGEPSQRLSGQDPQPYARPTSTLTVSRSQPLLPDSTSLQRTATATPTRTPVPTYTETYTTSLRPSPTPYAYEPYQWEPTPRPRADSYLREPTSTPRPSLVILPSGGGSNSCSNYTGYTTSCSNSNGTYTSCSNYTGYTTSCSNSNGTYTSCSNYTGYTTSCSSSGSSSSSTCPKYSSYCTKP